MTTTSSVMEYPPFAICCWATLRCATNGFSKPEAIFSFRPFAITTKSHLVRVGVSWNTAESSRVSGLIAERFFPIPPSLQILEYDWIIRCYGPAEERTKKGENFGTEQMQVETDSLPPSTGIDWIPCYQ